MSMEKVLKAARKKVTKVVVTFNSGKFTQPIYITNIENGIITAISARSDAQYPISYFQASDVSLIEASE